MGKRNKQPAKQNQFIQLANKPAVAARPVAPPAKQPTLLAVSVILFALWFVFLLVTAVFG